MKYYMVVVSIVFLGVNIDAADETYRCPNTVVVNNYVRTFGDSCYQFVNSEKNWYRARDDCRSRGGYLVTIRTEATQKFLYNTLIYKLSWPRKGLWIGASDEHKEGDWKWVTGHAVRGGYSNWDSDQPRCLFGFICTEHCGQMRLEFHGKWHDYQCDYIFDDYSYICEYPLGPKTTPKPSTATTRSTTTTTITSPSTTTLTTTLTSLVSSRLLPTQTVLPSTSLVMNSTEDEVVIPLNPIADVHVELLGKSQKSTMDETGASVKSTGLIVGLVLGILCGLTAGLCIGVFFFRRKNKKDKENLPPVFFANPYYGDASTPLNPPPPPPRDYFDYADDACCGAHPSTPLKQELNGCPAGLTMLSSRQGTERVCNEYDEITAQKLLNAAAKSARHLGKMKEEEAGATGGVYEDADLVDNHYDAITGENFYESVDTVRLAIQQNALNEKQEEERYVPFQLDSSYCEVKSGK